MNNDFSRQRLSLNPTVASVSNYVDKSPNPKRGMPEGLISLARGLQSLNPALKDLADTQEKKLQEEGYAEAMQIAEETGALKEHEDLWSRATAENPTLASSNPYLKRFLDRKTAKSLSVTRQKEAELAYINNGWGDLEDEEFQEKVSDFSKNFSITHAETLNKLDPRERAASFSAQTQGMAASLNERHLKEASAKVIAKRGALYNDEITNILDTNMDTLSGMFIKEDINLFNFDVADRTQSEKTTAIVAPYVEFFKNAAENYRKQGMTETEILERNKITLRQYAINNPDNADEIIALADVLFEGSPLLSKEERHKWGNETNALAFNAWMNNENKAFQEETINVKKTELQITNLLNSLPKEDLLKMPAYEILQMKLPDGSPIPAQYAAFVTTYVNALTSSTNTERTGDQAQNANAALVSIKKGEMSLDELMWMSETGRIHSLDFSRLSNGFSESGTSQTYALLAPSLNNIKTELDRRFENDTSKKLTFIQDLEATMINWMEDTQSSTGEIPNRLEINEKVTKAYQNMLKYPTYAEGNVETVLTPNQVAEKDFEYLLKLRNGEHGIPNSQGLSILNDQNKILKIQEQLAIKHGKIFPQQVIIQWIKNNMAINKSFMEAEAAKKAKESEPGFFEIGMNGVKNFLSTPFKSLFGSAQEENENR